jgi:3-oxoacyl-[acyl-carrier-protein] synthase-3
MLCHFSSEHFRSDVFKLMYETGLVVPEDRWFTNLHTKGNTGAASIFVMLEEAFNSGLIKNGNRVGMLVPESGRVSVGLAQLTAVDGVGSRPRTAVASTASPLGAISVPDDAHVAQMLRDLALVWADFERHLSTVPIVRRIESGNATLTDYQRLLVNLRQQVMEGGRWISRAASNISIDLFPLRSMFIGHAAEEHRDYQLLEQNFVATGGDIEVIRSAPKNIGSEALSAFIFHQASQPNPLDLLGAMFVIEGLGTAKADGWATRLRDQLDLTDDQISFFLYHGANDDDHFDKLREVLASEAITPDIAQRIVKTAKVTARLYALQLEELDRV